MNLHKYIPISESGERSREEYVQTYFNLSFPYEEILVFLSKFHGIVLSLRQLKQILKEMGLQRCKIRSSVHAVVSAIESELRGSGKKIEDCRLKIVDPEGVQRRLKHKLKRRQYKVKLCVAH